MSGLNLVNLIDVMDYREINEMNKHNCEGGNSVKNSLPSLKLSIF